MYITRERVNLPAMTCTQSASEISFADERMQAFIQMPSSTLDPTWIPRTFQDTDTEMTDNTCLIIQDFGGYNNYEHELASYGAV
jgi:hypothetical protein